MHVQVKKGKYNLYYRILSYFVLYTLYIIKLNFLHRILYILKSSKFIKNLPKLRVLKQVMSILENKRSILECLEVIEDSITDRIRRNPEIFYRYFKELQIIDPNKTKLLNIPTIDVTANRIYKTKKPQRSRKQIMLQQHEIRDFLNCYKLNVEMLDQTINEDFEKYKDDKMNFKLFQKCIETISNSYNEDNVAIQDLRSSLELKKQEYSMFSGSTSTEKNILSSKKQDLNIKSLFTVEENYGEYLSLEKFYQGWLNVINGNITILQFISMLEGFSNDQYLILSPVNRNSKIYRSFIKKLLDYMQKYFKRVYPLIDDTLLEQSLENEFSEYSIKSVNHNEKGCFCIACNKWFKTSTAYKYHLSGRKHLKNYTHSKKFLVIEFKLHKYSQYLSKEIENTKNFIERRLAFTNDERIAEMEKIKINYDAPAYDKMEQEETDHPRTKSNLETSTLTTPNLLNMPLGPDGYAMPYWLYKLQGLDIDYSCEICGNYIYKGRRFFERHFQETRHIYGLKCLGIESPNVFKDITKIEEAKRLWEQLKNSNMKKMEKLEIEVEDNDGNVMTERVYHELKKQGLF